MPFNHDNMIGVRLAEDLVNLACSGGWTPLAVCRLLRGSFVRSVDLVALDDTTVQSLRDWTHQLRSVFDSDSVAARTEHLNVLLEDGVRAVRLAVHDGLPPHLHFAGTEDDLVQRVKALTSGGLAIFAVEAEAGRMGVCARPGCGRVFVDTSKNGRRAYCSAKCGNTHAVHRYRDRQQGTGQSPGRPGSTPAR
ncbi:MAG TPA: CGNR zinc finger domain-containing protein [Arthrobacter sp.]